MTKRERLAERIKRDLGYEIEPSTWRTTHAGYWQRASGACSSIVQLRDGLFELMFFEPASEYLRRDRRLETFFDCYDIHVYAEPVRSDGSGQRKPNT